MSRLVSIGFEVSTRGDLDNATEVVPLVGGKLLTSLIHSFEDERSYGPASACGGLIPSYFRFGPLSMHYLGLGGGRPGAKVPLLGCSCGEWGCWPLLARVEANAATVSWSSFELPYRKDRDYSSLGPFTFERGAYDSTLKRMEIALSGLAGNADGD